MYYIADLILIRKVGLLKKSYRIIQKAITSQIFLMYVIQLLTHIYRLLTITTFIQKILKKTIK